MAISFVELEALSTSIEEDEEPSAYLSEMAPDFIDEPPVEVRTLTSSYS